jgi:hypothetical protein
LANKYARPDCLRRERGRFFDKPVGLDLASGVKNTEIPLRLKSNSQLGYDGIPLNGEEIIERYGRKKTTTHRFNPAFGGKFYWRRVGQTTPHTANIGQAIGS